MLENFEKENKLLPVFTREKKEDEKLSLLEIKQQVIQWHKENSNGGDKNFLPNGHQFEDAGPQHLPVIESIYDHGGFKEVAKILGLRFIKEDSINQPKQSKE